MREGLEAFNALVDKVLAYRPKQLKPLKRAKPRKQTQRRKKAKRKSE
jgi:rRNA processing protein Gar1